MGVIINEVCCIDANYLAESENENIHPGQFIDSQGKDVIKNVSNFENNILSFISIKAFTLK